MVDRRWKWLLTIYLGGRSPGCSSPRSAASKHRIRFTFHLNRIKIIIMRASRRNYTAEHQEIEETILLGNFHQTERTFVKSFEGRIEQTQSGLCSNQWSCSQREIVSPRCYRTGQFVLTEGTFIPVDGNYIKKKKEKEKREASSVSF